MPTDQEITLIRELQKGFDVCSRPFAALAERAGLTEDQLIAKLKEWKANGTIRRVGVIVNHYKAGFNANGMVVWDVPEDQIVEMGERLIQHEAITHCYSRPKCDRWPYRLYTMVHARSKEEVEAIVRQIAEHEGVEAYRILFSQRELKKAPTRLFLEDDR